MNVPGEAGRGRRGNAETCRRCHVRERYDERGTHLLLAGDAMNVPGEAGRGRQGSAETCRRCRQLPTPADGAPKPGEGTVVAAVAVGCALAAVGAGSVDLQVAMGSSVRRPGMSGFGLSAHPRTILTHIF